MQELVFIKRQLRFVLAAPAEMVDANIDQHFSQIVEHLALSVEPVAVEPKLGKRPLRQIFGVFHIPHQTERELNQWPLVLLNKRSELPLGQCRISFC